jgi:hypothetical protein
MFVCDRMFVEISAYNIEVHHIHAYGCSGQPWILRISECALIGTGMYAFLDCYGCYFSGIGECVHQSKQGACIGIFFVWMSKSSTYKALVVSSVDQNRLYALYMTV